MFNRLHARGHALLRLAKTHRRSQCHILLLIRSRRRVARNTATAYQNLSFSDHITQLSRSCFMHIRDLRRIRPMLDLKTASTIATSIVHAKLDYCNSLFLNIDVTQINRLHCKLFRMLSPVLLLKPQNTTTSLLFSKNSTGTKYLNAYNTKTYHSHTTNFKPPNPHIYVSCSPSNHLVQPDPHPL